MSVNIISDEEFKNIIILFKNTLNFVNGYTKPFVVDNDVNIEERDKSCIMSCCERLYKYKVVINDIKILKTLLNIYKILTFMYLDFNDSESYKYIKYFDELFVQNMKFITNNINNDKILNLLLDFMKLLNSNKLLEYNIENNDYKVNLLINILDYLFKPLIKEISFDKYPVTGKKFIESKDFDYCVSNDKYYNIVYVCNNLLLTRDFTDLYEDYLYKYINLLLNYNINSIKNMNNKLMYKNNKQYIKLMNNIFLNNFEYIKNNYMCCFLLSLFNHIYDMQTYVMIDSYKYDDWFDKNNFIQSIYDIFKLTFEIIKHYENTSLFDINFIDKNKDFIKIFNDKLSLIFTSMNSYGYGYDCGLITTYDLIVEYSYIVINILFKFENYINHNEISDAICKLFTIYKNTYFSVFKEYEKLVDVYKLCFDIINATNENTIKYYNKLINIMFENSLYIIRKIKNHYKNYHEIHKTLHENTSTYINMINDILLNTYNINCSSMTPDKKLKKKAISYSEQNYKMFLNYDKYHYNSYSESNDNKIRKVIKSIKELANTAKQFYSI